MPKRQFERSRRTRQLALAASTAVLALSLGSCQTSGLSDITSSLDITGSVGDKAADKSVETAASAPRRDIEHYRERFRANPKDTEAALEYGKALRKLGQRAQAVAVLEQASLAQPDNKALLAGYGRALADNGNFQQAFDVLSRAHSPEDPDWRILSAQGAALDQLGRYDQAREYYASALRIAPDEPTVLSNLGLSYVQSKDLAKAEETLRRANSLAKGDRRIRENFALVVGLQGRVAEAERILKDGRPADEAAADVAFLKRLLARNEGGRNDGGRKPVRTRAAELDRGD